MRKGVDRWTLIEDMLWEEGVHRSAQQCQVKWEKLTAKFKKDFGYEKDIYTIGARLILADDKH